MPKRKRLSSSHEDDTESVTSESSSAAPGAAGGVGTRKRRRVGAVSQEQLKQLLDALMNHKRTDGAYVSETFYRLPKRRNNPDYFETVQNPIDFAKIQVNLNTHQYDDISQLASDVELLVENAKQYYPRSSREYTDAVALWSAFNEHRAAIITEEPAADKPLKDEEKPEKITLKLSRMSRRGSEVTGDEESEAGSSVAPRSEASNWTPGEILFSLLSPGQHEPTPPAEDSSPPPSAPVVLDLTSPDGTVIQLAGPPESRPDVSETATGRDKLDATPSDPGPGPASQFVELEAADAAASRDPTVGSRRKDGPWSVPVQTDQAGSAAGSVSGVPRLTGALAGAAPPDAGRVRRRAAPSGGGRVRRRAAPSGAGRVRGRAARRTVYLDPSAAGCTVVYVVPALGEPRKAWQRRPAASRPLLPAPGPRPGAGTAAPGRTRAGTGGPGPTNAGTGSAGPTGAGTDAPGPTGAGTGALGPTGAGTSAPAPTGAGTAAPGPTSAGTVAAKPAGTPSTLCTWGSSDSSGSPVSPATMAAAESLSQSDSVVAEMRPVLKAASGVHTRQYRLKETPAAASTASARSKELEDALEELFTSIATSNDPEGRSLSTWFQLVPHRTKLPQYYEVIKQPMDLKTIAQRIQSSEYNSLQELETDLQLVFKNACTFNEPGSQIYKDAKVLKKLAQTRRAEIEHARHTAAKSSERIRSKRIGGVSCLSAELAQLMYDEDEEQSSSDSNMSEDSPLWQLFDSVRSYTTPAGFLLSEPFQTLPSRRLYPDYYDEIKNPIALRQIKRKMKNGVYSGTQDMVDDLNLMFENAKQYNPPESKLYKDAIRLQKVMQKKAAELAADFDEDNDDNSEDDSEPAPVRKSSHRRDHPVKERCKILYRTIRDYMHDDMRHLSSVFMELPSRKLYPDYYEIIDSPIDLARIESKIRADQYDTESEILQDFKLMFNNCRQYNEEGSVIYEDANILERVLMSKVRELGPLPAHEGVRNKPRVISRAQLLEKMWTLYNTIRDYKDSNDRQLSAIFTRLPSKLEYPDYFEVIKSPIHLERICQKLKTGTYNTLDEIMADLVLMFDNACKYNEPDSQVYKDSLTLHRLALQTKLQLTEDAEEVPDVKTLVQELLTSLFIATYNHQDSDGRCFSDSLAELPEHDEVDGQTKVRGISMEIIKRRLDRGLYTRLDAFQEDVFAVFERARRLSKPDSQTFEDAVEMQTFFISYRDELCRSGTLLSSPALQFTQDDLKTQLAQIKPEVRTSEEEESQEAKPTTAGLGDSMSFNQVQYRTGEFVYVEPKDKGVELHIVNIERLWTNSEGQQMMYGGWCFRPEETFHLPTRKFLEKEVFKSDQHIGCPLSQIVGKCAVLSVKDYFRMVPEGYAEEDVYVCESRYSSRSRSFKKIKVFPFAAPDNMREREVPLEPRRVMSVFRKRVEKHKEELAELEECEKIRTRELPNVEIDNRAAMDGNTYYEQLTCGPYVLKTGDCVYVKSEHSKQVIAQVDTMWMTPDGAQYFHGPQYMTATEIASSPQQLFYKQEVFVSLMEDTHPMVNITGKCCVLDYNDYCSRRPTEVGEESDVYVCENLFDESKRQIVPRGGEMKRYTHSEAVLEDEIYHFRRLLVLRKQPLAHIQQEANERIKSLFAEAVGVSSPAGSKVGDEDSLDGPPASVGSADNSYTPQSSRKSGSKRLKILTGYILYSADIRKKITSKNPSANFGDISRLVGTEWKNLSAPEKAAYEERAARMNADSVAALRVETADTPSRAPLGASLVGPDVVYDCCWLGCDHQYEDMADLIDHCNLEPNGHVPLYAATVDEYQCQWRGCNRIKKGAVPFPNSARLSRHVKEVHIQKNNGRVVAPHERSRNFVPRRAAAGVATRSQAGAGAGSGSGVSTPTGAVAAAPEPRFVAAPPRPHRLLHSEAYIRYIETLQPERVHVGGWERQLQASPDTVPVPDTARLPTHWLAEGLTDAGSVVKTLWHLRDYLMKDALGIARAYDGKL